MRPTNLKSKIFLDSADPEETREAVALLGFLDGQTTNPTLIAKNPAVKGYLNAGGKLNKNNIDNFYRLVAKEISGLIPGGSVSVEVYADKETSTESMVREAENMFGWIPNAHIKLPITSEGLIAANYLVKEKIRVNMTLCFSEEQAAAVYISTKGAVKGQVFISPFIGRLDDRGENGMDLIKNIIKMYRQSDGHVEVLTASARNLDHFFYAIQLGSDIITAPFKILKEWADKKFPLPQENYFYNRSELSRIAYKNLDLNKSVKTFNIAHDLTDAGIIRFSEDWNKLIS
ncbi:MAG: transaldolase [Candidatus Brennerbacteria bacterium]|nr:transaldolase [Candidatus Brennerbacteria bacterium]